jgi:hypothetical protein
MHWSGVAAAAWPTSVNPEPGTWFSPPTILNPPTVALAPEANEPKVTDMDVAPDVEADSDCTIGVATLALENSIMDQPQTVWVALNEKSTVSVVGEAEDP